MAILFLLFSPAFLLLSYFFNLFEVLLLTFVLLYDRSYFRRRMTSESSSCPLIKTLSKKTFSRGACLATPTALVYPPWDHSCVTSRTRYVKVCLHVLFFLSFPCCRGEASHSALRCRATFDICSLARCRWSFLSNFLLRLPFLELSSHNPPISAVVFLVFCNLLVSLFQIFLVFSRLSFLPLRLTSLLTRN